MAKLCINTRPPRAKAKESKHTRTYTHETMGAFPTHPQMNNPEECAKSPDAFPVFSQPRPPAFSAYTLAPPAPKYTSYLWTFAPAVFLPELSCCASFLTWVLLQIRVQMCLFPEDNSKYPLI